MLDRTSVGLTKVGVPEGAADVGKPDSDTVGVLKAGKADGAVVGTAVDVELDGENVHTWTRSNRL